MDFPGKKRSNKTDAWTTDSEARLARKRKEKEAKFSYRGHLMRRPRVTVGADKGYDTTAFVDPCRHVKITPHVAQKRKGSAIDGRTTRHEGDSISLRKSERIEEVFGWMKTIGRFRKRRPRELRRRNGSVRLLQPQTISSKSGALSRHKLERPLFMLMSMGGVGG